MPQDGSHVCSCLALRLHPSCHHRPTQACQQPALPSPVPAFLPKILALVDGNRQDQDLGDVHELRGCHAADQQTTDGTGEKSKLRGVNSSMRAHGHMPRVEPWYKLLYCSTKAGHGIELCYNSQQSTWCDLSPRGVMLGT